MISNIEGKKLFTVSEIAEKLDVSAFTIRRYIRKGILKANKIGRKWYVLESVFKEYFKKASEN